MQNALLQRLRFEIRSTIDSITYQFFSAFRPYTASTGFHSGVIHCVCVCVCVCVDGTGMNCRYPSISKSYRSFHAEYHRHHHLRHRLPSCVSMCVGGALKHFCDCPCETKSRRLASKELWPICLCSCLNAWRKFCIHFRH